MEKTRGGKSTMGIIRRNILLPVSMIRELEENGDPRELVILAIKNHLERY